MDPQSGPSDNPLLDINASLFAMSDLAYYFAQLHAHGLSHTSLKDGVTLVSPLLLIKCTGCSNEQHSKYLSRRILCHTS